MKLDIDKDKLLILLIFTDLFFIILHILYIYTDLLQSSLYSLSRDRGYAEFFQYTKEYWVALLLLILGFKQRRVIYFIFSLLFLYFLFDDSIEFHERLGEFLADFMELQPALSLRSVDYGELLVSAVFGLLFLISITLSYLHSDRTARRISHYLIGLILVVAFFGVFMDMVGIVAASPEMTRVLLMVEEGGEMLVMSVITWFVYRLRIREPGELLSWPPRETGEKS